MATSGGPNTTTEGLVFGYDTGYPLVSGSHETYKFNKGEPTTTFDIGTMVPTSPNTFFTSSDTYHYNMHGTVWDWTYYPNSNVSTDGGMEWIPNYEGPGCTGAWKMKKRSGGNSESNFSGTAPGSIDADKDYTVSVWCKTDQASCFRIHLNTTKDGSSYWGYASGYHSGRDIWERLSVTIPSGSLNTSLNTIRFQALGTNVDADAYCRDYQVEQRDHATPFILGRTRSVSGSLIDLTRTHDIDLSNVSFNSNAQINYDGTDDHAVIPYSPTDLDGDVIFSVEAVIKRTGTMSNGGLWGIGGDGSAVGINGYVHPSAANKITIDLWGTATFHAGIDYPLNEYVHVVWVKTTTGFSTSTLVIYINGVAYTGSDLTVMRGSSHTPNLNTSTNGKGIVIGRVGPETDLYHAPGEMPIFKVYNNALSAAEVKENYNAIKNRFNI